MSNNTINNEQGHWILAKMGKKVLRPGGKDLTKRLINNLAICPSDDIVEFAPGLGFSATFALQHHPHSYTGIEQNEEAAGMLSKTIAHPNSRVVIGNAADSTLEAGKAGKAFGEAMLTMHADHRKSAIIREAHRILKPGGLYGIHELGLAPDDIDDATKGTIQKALAKTIKVNARPMTISEWSGLLEKEGFLVKTIETNPMHLLKTSRIIADEGLGRFFKILFNFLRHHKERQRVLAMRETFIKYEENLNAVAIVAEKL